MDRNEKIKIAITSGIVAVILLILVLFLALSGKKDNDEKLLNENISEYASIESSGDLGASSGNLSSAEVAASASEDEGSEYRTCQAGHA